MVSPTHESAALTYMIFKFWSSSRLNWICVFFILPQIQFSRPYYNLSSSNLHYPYSLLSTHNPLLPLAISIHINSMKNNKWPPRPKIKTNQPSQNHSQHCPHHSVDLHKCLLLDVTPTRHSVILWTLMIADERQGHVLKQTPRKCSAHYSSQ